MMDNKETLIASTQELLWQRGYVGTSPRDILQHSGVGQGSMYHHFSGKAELACVAIQRSAENLQAQAKTHLAAPGSAIVRITTFLERERDILRGCQMGRLAMDPDIIATENLRQPLEDAFAGLRNILIAVLTEGIEQGELAESLDANATAELILATMQGGYVLSRAANSEAPFRKAIKGLLAILKTQVRIAKS